MLLLAPISSALLRMRVGPHTPPVGVTDQCQGSKRTGGTRVLVIGSKIKTSDDGHILQEALRRNYAFMLKDGPVDFRCKSVYLWLP